MWAHSRGTATLVQRGARALCRGGKTSNRSRMGLRVQRRTCLKSSRFRFGRELRIRERSRANKSTIRRRTAWQHGDLAWEHSLGRRRELRTRPDHQGGRRVANRRNPMKSLACQRPAKRCTPVRFRPPPPSNQLVTSLGLLPVLHPMRPWPVWGPPAARAHLRGRVQRLPVGEEPQAPAQEHLNLARFSGRQQ
jgi:hypothetical protein